MKKLLFFALSICAIYSCEEIVSVPDISGEVLQVVAPSDGSVLNSTDVTFSWNELEFAEQYQIQVAQPSFLEASQVVLDTILGDSLQDFRSFSKTLNPNTYQWRLRGLNTNYTTQYISQSFTVDTISVGQGSNDISDEVITLIAPAQDAVVSNTTVNFNWESLSNATEYRIQIAFPNFENPEQIALDVVTTANSYMTDLPDDEYEWRIKGINDSSETSYSTQGFSVTTLADISGETLVLLAPSDGLVINDTNVTFSWESLDEATSYRFQIAFPDFDNPIELVVDESFTNVTSQSFNLDDNSSYQWRVKALNETTETPYTTRDISINVTEELSEQMINIVAPEDMFETQEISVNLSWETLDQASLYRVIITDQSDNSIYAEQTVTDSNVTVVFDIGTYAWAVRGESTTENTPYTEQTITILE